MAPMLPPVSPSNEGLPKARTTRKQLVGEKENKRKRPTSKVERPSVLQRGALPSLLLPASPTQQREVVCFPKECVYTREHVYQLYDVFRSIATEDADGKTIRRQDFFNAMRCLPLEGLRVFKRCAMQQRFMLSASPVGLDELLIRQWPDACQQDFLRMRGWCDEREVKWFVLQDSFKGDTADIKTIFCLIDHDRRGYISAKQLRRVGIFESSDVTEMFRKQDKLDLSEFTSLARERLKAKYARTEAAEEGTGSIMKAGLFQKKD